MSMEERKRHMAALPESMRRMSLDNSALDTAHIRSRFPLFAAGVVGGVGDVGGRGGEGGEGGLGRGVATIVEEGQHEGVLMFGWVVYVVMCMQANVSPAKPNILPASFWLNSFSSLFLPFLPFLPFSSLFFLFFPLLYVVSFPLPSTHPPTAAAPTNSNQFRVCSAPPSSAPPSSARSSDDCSTPPPVGGGSQGGGSQHTAGPAGSLGGGVASGGGCAAGGGGPATRGASGAPMRVLIAEDNKVNQMVICKVLQRVIPETVPDVVNNGKEVCEGEGGCVRVRVGEGV